MQQWTFYPESTLQKQKMNKKVAVIGSGISGLTCANLLKSKFDVHLFESSDRLGGHTYTVKIPEAERNINIDCGFIVFNMKNYPNFVKLLPKNYLEFEKSEMSFSYYSPKRNFYYNGHNLQSIFSDKRNFTNPSFYKMLVDIILFNNKAKFLLKNTEILNISLKEYLTKNSYGHYFVDFYLVPMISAIWSMGKDDCLDMPLKTVLSFFYNHGLLNLFFRPQWYTIKNGASEYIPIFLEGIPESNIHLASNVNKIVRSGNQVNIVVNQEVYTFDKVIIATHSDQALAMLEQPTKKEHDVLSRIQYEPNEITLHTDQSIMPPNPKAWASWNYYEKSDQTFAVTYYANRLQNLQAKNDYFISLNLNKEISPSKILKQFYFSHVVLNDSAIRAQNEMDTISGLNNIYFCGAYCGNGFHEDGVKSAMKVCDAIRLTY